MEKLPLSVFNKSPEGIVKLPGSKSITNRVLMLAALSEGQTIITNPGISDDSSYFMDSLKKLGFLIIKDQTENSIVVAGFSGSIPSHSAEIFVGNAGTAARFLTAFATLGDGFFSITGDERMRERPIGDLVQALQSLGVDIRGTQNTSKLRVCPPVEIIANGLNGGEVDISGKTSSQYLSALLMIAPYAKKAIQIKITDQLNSKPYVVMTMRMMKDFGVIVQNVNYQDFKIQPGKYKTPGTYNVEPDASAASYFLALPALSGGKIVISNLHQESIQGDVRFIDILKTMGLRIVDTNLGLESSFSKNSKLKGIKVDMSDIPDTAQTLAVLAPFAQQPVEIRGIASARVKETDRINATCTELRKLGVKVKEFEDGMRIYPCEIIKPTEIETYNDHRMAMSFALIGTKIKDIVINDPSCVKKTFPEYFSTLERLRL